MITQISTYSQFLPGSSQIGCTKQVHVQYVLMENSPTATLLNTAVHCRQMQNEGDSD